MRKIAVTTLFASKDSAQLDNQIEAVASWEQAGFTIFSCNVQEEQDRLRGLFPSVTFFVPERSGLEEFGKPYIYVSRLLAQLKQMGFFQCAVFNSDIRLRHTDAVMLEFILADAQDSLLFLHRYDIEQPGDKEGSYYFSGIDAFFLNAQNSHLFPEQGYAIGRPEWDHWMVYCAVQAGMPVYEIKNPIAYHLYHQQRWTPEESSARVLHSQSPKRSDVYYRITNGVMSDFQVGRVYGSHPSVEQYRLVLESSLYPDHDNILLMAQYASVHGYESIAGSIGLGYRVGDRLLRICALHGKRREQYGAACMLYKGDDTPAKPQAQSGILTAYVDIRDFWEQEQPGRFYLYPSGRAARLMLDGLQTLGYEPLGIVDRNPSLHGTDCGGYPILAPEVLLRVDYDKVLVVSNLYPLEIYEELARMIDSSRIIVI